MYKEERVFKRGDRVRVVSDSSCHSYKIGSVVIIESDPEYLSACKNYNYTFKARDSQTGLLGDYLSSDEVVKVNIDMNFDQEIEKLIGEDKMKTKKFFEVKMVYTGSDSLIVKNYEVIASDEEKAKMLSGVYQDIKKEWNVDFVKIVCTFKFEISVPGEELFSVKA